MNRPLNRRAMLVSSALVSSGLASTAAFTSGAAGTEQKQAEEKRPKATADSCIMLWLGGGACHVDTLDPKRQSTGIKDPGSAYAAIPTATQGVSLCEHMPQLAKLMDRASVIRTLNHDVIDEHAAATNRVHTGRPPTGTTLYPSIGSVTADQLGARGERVPPYVVMGYPSASRGPGFLGASAGYVYLTDTKAGPAGLRRPVNDLRSQRRESLLAGLRDQYEKRLADDIKVKSYTTSGKAGLKLSGPDFMQVFDLASESDSLRQEYGSEFGQRCLLARRLVENGVRFVEVSYNLNFINGTGWDTHNEGQQNQHLLIQDLDKALGALIRDLEKRGRLDKTLIAVATEFGRPPEFDGGGGRGHYSKAFSGLLAGGGLQTGKAIGTTDDLGKKIVDRPVSIPDFHATIYQAMGIDPAHELYDGDRPVPITDQGQPIAELFS
jgi:hypothetical protein